MRHAHPRSRTHTHTRAHAHTQACKLSLSHTIAITVVIVPSVHSNRSTHPSGCFVFPALFLVVLKLFATGLAKSSARLLLLGTDKSCPQTAIHACKGLAIFALALVLSLLLIGWTSITYFNLSYRKVVWKQGARPETVQTVDDHCFRWAAKLRLKLCGTRASLASSLSCFLWPCRATQRHHSASEGITGASGAEHERRAFTGINRMRGKYAKPKADTAEPERTERLLGGFQLLTLHKRNASDTMDAYQFPFAPRSNGAGPFTVYFDLCALTVAIVTAVLAAYGSTCDPGSGCATVQVTGTFSLQLGFAAFIAVRTPHPPLATPRTPEHPHLRLTVGSQLSLIPNRKPCPLWIRVMRSWSAFSSSWRASLPCSSSYQARCPKRPQLAFRALALASPL